MGYQGESIAELDRRVLAFLASSGAAAIHFGAAKPHLAEYGPAGAFMLLSGALQLAWAMWVVVGMPRAALMAGLAGNVAIIVLWGFSRTTGIPWGAHPWTPERINGTDLLATALESLVIVAVWGLIERSHKHPPGYFIATVWIATLATAFVSAEDPTRERLTAIATLILAVATGTLIQKTRAMLAARPDRRGHEKTWFGSRRASLPRADAGAGVVAGG